MEKVPAIAANAKMKNSRNLDNHNECSAKSINKMKNKPAKILIKSIYKV